MRAASDVVIGVLLGILLELFASFGTRVICFDTLQLKDVCAAL